MLDMTRVYKLNNKIISTFIMFHQNAVLTATQLNKTYGFRFTGNWNNSEHGVL